ncbi:hypothetical protein [Serratia marcescens]|uniref:hypothetical protein n=1 Tax=Serratia marcescens TaxID=615 RepID=UPI0011855FC2|nr:hypothetical protein [Serratia marcescens]
MTNRILIILLLFMSSANAGSWGRAHETIIEGIQDRVMYVSYDWGIMPPNDVPGTVQCGAASCYFGPVLRAGVGPINGDYCDGGGVCSGFASNVLPNFMVIVPNGTPYATAYKTYSARFGLSGRYVRFRMGKYIPQSIAWGRLCVGFASLPVNAAAVSILAPDSSCGLVPPPEISCNIQLPRVLDMGTPVAGRAVPPVSEQGYADCIGDATISAALLNAPKLDGNAVTISINNKVLTSTSQSVGSGTNIILNTVASVSTPFQRAGHYETDAILLMSYY